MDRVRLTVERVNLANLKMPTEVLLDLTDTAAEVEEHAVAWATVRGANSLVASLRAVFADPHRDGWCVVVNRPTSCAVVATWPWCDCPHDLYLLASRLR